MYMYQMVLMGWEIGSPVIHLEANFPILTSQSDHGDLLIGGEKTCHEYVGIHD